MIFKGSATALITPFTKDKVDFDAFSSLIDFQAKNNTKAAIILGTTGEPATLTEQEKEALISLGVKKLKGKIPVIIGTGSNNTAKTVADSVKAQELGADALLVVTPYYNKCTQEGLIAHYGAIANAVDIPIIAYNVPSRTGLNLLPATFAKMVDRFENIKAIKEASGSMEQISETIRLVQNKAEVYSGDDAIIVPLLAMGGAGVIGVASNVIPAYISTMCELFFNGQLQKAAQMQLDALPFIKALFSEVNPIPIKYASKLANLTSGLVRLPLTQMSEDKANVLKQHFNELKSLYKIQ